MWRPSNKPTPHEGKQSSTEFKDQDAPPGKQGPLRGRKSIVDLAQDFFRLRLGSSEDVEEAQPSSARRGSWNPFASTRGRRSSASNFVPQEDRKVSLSNEAADSGEYPFEQIGARLTML